jgi:hypothetical protein
MAEADDKALAATVDGSVPPANLRCLFRSIACHAIVLVDATSLAQLHLLIACT